MKLKDMQMEELEMMSLTDITYMILKENKKSMKTADLFKEISELLEYSEADFTSKIGDYYTSLNIDKRFVLLDNNEWDLRDNHSIKIEMDEDEDEEEVEETEEDEIEEEIEEENIDDIVDDDDIDDELDDLTIVTDDDEDDE